MKTETRAKNHGPVRLYICQDCRLKYWPVPGKLSLFDLIMSHNCPQCGGHLRMIIEGAGDE